MTNTTELHSIPPQHYSLCSSEANSLAELLVIFSLQCFINPGLSIIGFITNMLSLAILHRSGLHKPSNILLFGLVIADSWCLFTTMNFAMILNFFGPNKYFKMLCGFQYEETVNLFLAYSEEVFFFLGYWGRYVNTLIPIFITLERNLAVFKPMTFKAIVKKQAAITVVVLSFVFWLPWTLFYSALTEIINWSLTDEITWTTVIQNLFFYENMEIITFFEIYVVDCLVSWIPLSVISIGCCVLGIKVKLTLLKRRRFNSAKKLMWSPRTTLTLMTTCFVFTTTHAVASLIQYLAPCDIYVHVLMRNYFVYFFYALNASSNFFVYIATNEKLFHIFLQMFCVKYKKKQKA
ncbi:G-protein coupled receptor [Biomphalaria glabrata]|nr:G-protein coupled receptor [Biomphalaria glabrata]